MQGRTLLLRSPNDSHARRATALLRSAGNQIVCHRDPQACLALLEAGGVDALIVERSDGAAVGALLQAARDRDVPCVLTDEGEERAMALMGEGLCDHLVCGDGRLERMTVTVEKMLRPDGSFGIDKFLPRYGIEVYRHEIGGGHERHAALDHLGELLNDIGTEDHTVREILGVTRELIDNALYSAPRDPRGRRRYSNRDRQSGASVGASEHAQLCFAFDGQSMIVSVTDWFGTLDRERVRRRLAVDDSREATQPSALRKPRGRGLRGVWAACTELSITMEAGHRTEVVATRDLGRAPGRRSLHIFRTAAPGATESAAPTASVEVSDSMLIDIRSHLTHRPRLAVRKADTEPGDLDITAPYPLDR